MARIRAGFRRRGGVLVLVGLMLPAMIFLAALIMDGGVLMSRRRQTQAVADASAHAAACLLAKNYLTGAGLDTTGTARAAALAIANDNGYANDASGGSPAGLSTSVTVNIPPTSGLFANKPGNAEVIVTYNQPRFFSAAFGSTAAIPVTARAVGRVVNNGPTSILLTDPSSAGALTLTGGAVLATTGTIQVNSSSASAVTADNGAFAADLGGVDVVGGTSIPNWALPPNFFLVAPRTGQASVSDPNAALPAPSLAALGTQGPPALPYGAATLNPGVYSGGLTLGGGMVITMNPGVYYMKGGGLTVANGVALTGVGVTIYTDAGGGALNFGGGAVIALTAPTSGTYKDIVYYQDRANSASLNRISNGAAVTMLGTIYAPSAPLAISGGVAASVYGTKLIVKSLSLSNGVNISISPPAGGGGTAAPFLAE